MTSSDPCQRLIVVGGWGVAAEMLSGIYAFWPGEVVPVSLGDDLVSRCHSLSEVTDELLSLYPEPSVWMGWSLGSQIVMEAASRPMGPVSCAITLGGFPRFVATEDWPRGMAAGEFSAFRRGIRRDPQCYWQHFLLLMINGAGESQQERQHLTPWLKKGPPVCRDNLSKSLEWLRAADQRSLWQAVATPVLHLMGGGDKVVRPWKGYMETPLSSIVEVLPAMAHWPGGCSASACRDLIRSFLDSGPGRISWAS